MLLFTSFFKTLSNEYWGTKGEYRAKIKHTFLVGKTSLQELEILQGITPCHVHVSRTRVTYIHHVFLSGRKRSKRSPRRWKMIPGIGSLQQAGLRSISRNLVCGVRRLSVQMIARQVDTKKGGVGRLLLKIWTCEKSALKWGHNYCGMIRRGAVCRSVWTSSCVFKKNQIALYNPYRWRDTTRKPNAKAVGWSHQRRRGRKSKTKTKVKVILMTFFDVMGIGHSEFSPQGLTINQ